MADHLERLFCRLPVRHTGFRSVLRDRSHGLRRHSHDHDGSRRMHRQLYLLVGAFRLKMDPDAGRVFPCNLVRLCVSDVSRFRLRTNHRALCGANDHHAAAMRPLLHQQHDQHNHDHGLMLWKLQVEVVHRKLDLVQANRCLRTKLPLHPTVSRRRRGL